MRKLFIFIAIFFSFSAQTMAQDLVPDRRFVLHRDVDFFGSDLQSIFDTSLENCESACLGDTQCRAFTFNTRNSSCFLKSSISDEAEYSGAFSGEIVNEPQAVLAAIILVALKRLFLQARELPALFKVKKADGLVWAFVFVAVLGLGVSNGLVAGVLFSLAVVVYKQLRPYTAVLGRFRGTRNYGPVARFGAETSEWPRIKVVFYGADLFYGNVGRLASSIDAFVDEAITDYVVLDLSAAADADITAIKALAALRTELAGRGVTLFISHPHKRILSLLAALRLDELPDDILFTETHDACLAALAALESAASVTQQPQQPLPSSSPSLPQPRAVSGRVITSYGSIQ